MWLKDKTGVGLHDPSPSTPLQDIASIAARAEALIARSDSPLLRTDFLRLFGVVTILSGLEYHHANQLRALSNLPNPPGRAFSEVRHETIAWLNRAGQLYYFCTSAFVADRVSQLSISSLQAVLPFRHKHSAHRSIDKPLRDDSEHLQLSQALALSDLSGSQWSPRPGLDTDPNAMPTHRTHYAKFQLRPDEGDHIQLNLELQHPDVALEGYSLLEALLASAPR